MVEHQSTTDSADVNPIKGLWIKFQVNQISTSEVSLLDSIIQMHCRTESKVRQQTVQRCISGCIITMHNVVWG